MWNHINVWNTVEERRLSAASSVRNDPGFSPRGPISPEKAKRHRPNVPTGHYGSAATSEPKYKRSIETSLPHF
jgi:hypothetical protein